MGRQRLYHSAEEKQAANRAKSKRSYDKYVTLIVAFNYFLTSIGFRRKDSINILRRKKYAKDHKQYGIHTDGSCPTIL